MLKNISFHQSYKYGCLLDENVCNNKQKWNKENCRCLKKEKCSSNSFFNVINCSFQMKKMTALIEEEEECDVETSDKIKCIENKIVTLIKKIENCKPFVASSILLVCISVILTGIIIILCLNRESLIKINFVKKVDL